MIYLSCIEVDLAQGGARRWLSNPYQIHQRLLSAWPDQSAGRVLYRVEMDRRPPRVLVQSAQEAEWDRCFRDPALLACRPEQKRLDLAVRAGQVLRFFLRANPTARRLEFDRTAASPEQLISGQRVGLLRQEEQVDWLQRKAEGAGFQILAVEARDRGDHVSYRASTRTRLTHRCVDFEGRLRVTDPERLKLAVTAGIGPGKAFGFGLLSLAPAGGA